MKHLFGLLATIAVATKAFAQERSPDDETYYKSWIGCKAPPIRFDRSDRTNYAQATYDGKRLLLYSFDAGNFARMPDLPRVTDELQSLHRVRTKASEPFFVIGYTRGVLWNPVLGLKDIPKKLDQASRFPIVNLINKRDENALGEPYGLLDSPGGILIGTNGIICAVFLHPLTEKDFQAVASTPAWAGPPRDPPQKRK
jgi:hypothetical protein